MRTKEFIDIHCVGTFCPDFDWNYGCRAYDGEECDEAWGHPRWRDKAMRDRIDEFCVARREKKAERDKKRKRK